MPEIDRPCFPIEEMWNPNTHLHAPSFSNHRRIFMRYASLNHSRSLLAGRTALPFLLLSALALLGIVAMSRSSSAQCWSGGANGVFVPNACAVVWGSSGCVYDSCWLESISCTCSPDDPNYPNHPVQAIEVTNNNPGGIGTDASSAILVRVPRARRVRFHVARPHPTSTGIVTSLVRQRASGLPAVHSKGLGPDVIEPCRA